MFSGRNEPGQDRVPGQIAKSSNCNSFFIADQKRLATLRAKCAIAGIVLRDTDDDRGQPLYIANHLSLTKAFGNLDDLGVWLGCLTGHRHE